MSCHASPCKNGKRKAMGERHKNKTGLKHTWDSPEDSPVVLNAPVVLLGWVRWSWHIMMMLKLAIFTPFDLKSKVNSGYFCLEKLKNSNACCFMLVFKKRCQKHVSHWHYTYIEKDYVYDRNPLYFTLKKYVLFLQKLSAIYGAKGWCFYLFSLVTFIVLECKENLIVSYYVWYWCEHLLV